MKITFLDYLRGTDKSFWNPLKFPRWTYLLIPIAISGARTTFFDFLVGEIILVPLLYITYLFNRRRITPTQNFSKVLEDKEVSKNIEFQPANKKLFKNRKDFSQFVVFSVTIVTIFFLLFYFLKI